MTGAMVNARMVPFTHVLKNGDIVSVLTSKSSKGPSRDWLTIIKSPEARNKIRQWFKKERREENVMHGKLSFDSELNHANIKMADIMAEDILTKVLSRASFSALDEMYAAIGYGGISAQRIVNRFKDELHLISKTKRKEDATTQEVVQKEVKIKRPQQGVMVEGLDNCLVKFARCCSPIPGDAIVGFITRGFGVSVHRQDCVNYVKTTKAPEADGRWVRVSWGDTGDTLYAATIDVQVLDRTGIVVDVASILNAMNVRISAFNARTMPGGNTMINIIIDIKNRNELVSAMAKLMGVSGVTDVRRADV